MTHTQDSSLTDSQAIIENLEVPMTSLGLFENTTKMICIVTYNKIQNYIFIEIYFTSHEIHPSV